MNKQTNNANGNIDADVKQINNFSEFKEEINIKIDDLQKQAKRNIPKWVYWVWLISIIAFGFSIAALFIRISYNWNVEFLSRAIILAFVGILATFIVISNYAQVKEVKDEFKTKVAGIERMIDEKVSDVNTKMNNNHQKYIQIIRAMSEYEKGAFFLTYDDKSISLSSYMHSLDMINFVHEDDITDIVISAIDRLRQVEDTCKDKEKRIHLSHGRKIRYVEILRESNHRLSDNLIKWIKKIPKSDFDDIVEQLMLRHP